MANSEPECPPRHRVYELFCHEAKLAKLVEQCASEDPRDVIHADYRFDQVYQVYQYFSTKTDKEGRHLNFRDLFAWQRRMPIIYPWNTEYDSLRQNVNRRYNIFPYMIVMAETDEHVQFALELAKEYDIPIRLRGGAHNFEALSLTEGMIIDQSRRTKMKIVWETQDESLNRDIFERSDQYSEQMSDQRTSHSRRSSRRAQQEKIPYVYLEAGCLLGPIAEYLASEGLVMIMGSCPNNGAVGFLLGGGIGFLSRFYGLGSDSLVSVRTITANGKTLIATPDSHKDLLWASRGAGGGNFGIVTGLKVRVYPIKRVTVFRLSFAQKDLKQVLRAWQIWFPTSNNKYMSQVSIFNGKDISLQGIYLGHSSIAEVEFEKFLEENELIPKEKIIKRVNYLDSALFFAGKGRWLLHFKAKNALIQQALPEKALNIIEKYISQSDGTDIFEITSLGGRMSEIPIQETAYAHRDAFAWMMINAHWSRQDQTEEKMAWTRSFYRELLPYLSGEQGLKVYVNTPDCDLTGSFLRNYYGENLQRLREIKKKYDPENLFNYSQSIPPAD